MLTVQKGCFRGVDLLRPIEDSAPLFMATRRSAWKEELLKILCQYIGCSFAYRKSDSKISCFLIGHIDHIVACRSAWIDLISYIESRASSETIQKGKTALNSYRLGFVAGIRQIAQSSLCYKAERLERAAKFSVQFGRYCSMSENASVPIIDFIYNDAFAGGSHFDIASLIEECMP